MDAPKLTPVIVCFSNLDWDYLRYRKQHLMERLTRTFEVIYVNPPRAVKARNPRNWNTVRRLHDRLWILEPIVLPGVRRSRTLKHLNDRLIAQAIRRIPVSRTAPVAWAYSPHARRLVDLIHPRLVVYDVADNYTTPSGVHVRDRREQHELNRLAELEASMLRRADLVFCVSEPLAGHARRSHPSVHVVPNGCDYEAHAAASRTAPRLTPVMADESSVTPRPRIGYVGTVAPRVDVELLIELARRHPEWDVEVVGPVSPLVELDHRRMTPNLMWTGEVPYSRVPDVVSRFDVGILPLREIPFATDCSPIQVFDYLAAGKPVVSTPVSQLELLPELVRTARGVIAFSEAIVEALADVLPERRASRQAFARANSWDARVDTILELLRRAGATNFSTAA